MSGKVVAISKTHSLYRGLVFTTSNQGCSVARLWSRGQDAPSVTALVESGPMTKLVLAPLTSHTTSTKTQSGKTKPKRFHSQCLPGRIA